MSISVNASAALAGAGSFATSRRGAVGYDEIAQARAALGSRATAAQVAKMIGRCEADVRPFMACRSEIEAAQVLVTLRPVAPDPQTPRQSRDDQHFSDLWEQGVKTAALAARFGLSDSGILHWAARLGLKSRAIKSDKVIWTPALDEIVKRDFVSGDKTAAEVASAIPGATKAAVIARAFRKGWCAPTHEKVAA
ncbi:MULTISPECIES: hypothetical protein [Brevundimonas]|uniref:hypothetical protein n=1 Tax=Brevundimonas TaxID=41275 RepID=UPI0025C1A138|nr:MULTISPECIES: hypothetical protein [Brevundimonas]